MFAADASGPRPMEPRTKYHRGCSSPWPILLVLYQFQMVHRMMELCTHEYSNQTTTNGWSYKQLLPTDKTTLNRSKMDTKGVPSPRWALTTRKDTNRNTSKWADNTQMAHLDQTASWLNIATTHIQQIYYVLPATTYHQPNETGLCSHVSGKALWQPATCNSFQGSFSMGHTNTTDSILQICLPNKVSNIYLQLYNLDIVWMISLAT